MTPAAGQAGINVKKNPKDPEYPIMRNNTNLNESEREHEPLLAPGPTTHLGTLSAKHLFAIKKPNSFKILASHTTTLFTPA